MWRRLFIVVAAVVIAGLFAGAARGEPTRDTGATVQLAADSCLQAWTVGTDKVVGKQTIYDRRASLYQVCEGFGEPDTNGFHLTPTMQCAIIAAAATYGGPVISVGVAKGCEAGDVITKLKAGDWLGAAKGVACGYFSEIFAGSVGVFAAGATSATGPGAVAVGVATYRALAASLKLACGGLLGVGTQLGRKLEAHHETAIAIDVLRHGRCISLKHGLLGLSWSAVTCPAEAPPTPAPPVITGVSGNIGVIGAPPFPVTVSFEAPSCDIVGGTWTDQLGGAHAFRYGGPKSRCSGGSGSTVPGYGSCTSPSGQPGHPGSYPQTIVIRDSHGQQSKPFVFSIVCRSP